MASGSRPIAGRSTRRTSRVTPVWEDVALDETNLVGVTDTSATLVYRATGRRPDGSVYRTYASSVYIRDGDTWKLVLHQQTPIPND